MFINKTLQYAVVYSTLSIGLLSWSLYDSLIKSYNYTMLLVEMTDGVKLAIFINFILFSFLALFKILQITLFGSLRIIELEHIVERLPIFAINLFLNLATGENNVILNVFLIGLSMTFKVLHIIMFDRLDFLNLVIVNKLTNEELTLYQVLKHFGTSINFWLNIAFIIIDFYIAEFLVYDVFQGINSVACLLFGFQFAVQGVEALTYFAKLILGIYEIVFYRIRKNERRALEDEFSTEHEQVNDEDYDDEEIEIIWENKPFYSKGVDIVSAILTAVSYICFIYLLTVHSGLSLPLSMLQGTYSSLRKAWTQIKQLMALIESSKRLDSQLMNATTTDLSQADNLCIICREDMHSTDDYQRLFKKPQSPRRCAKKLQCGHILHMGCLKEWLERSDSCPLCRRNVFGAESTTTSSIPQQPIVPNEHPGDEAIPGEEQLQRGLREIDNYLENVVDRDLQNQIPTVTPTPTEPIEELAGSSSTQLQSIQLPRNALIPRDWSILPLERVEDPEVDYKLKISNTHLADMKLVLRETNSEYQ